MNSFHRVFPLKYDSDGTSGDDSDRSDRSVRSHAAHCNSNSNSNSHDECSGGDRASRFAQRVWRAPGQLRDSLRARRAIKQSNGNKVVSEQASGKQVVSRQQSKRQAYASRLHKAKQEKRRRDELKSRRVLCFPDLEYQRNRKADVYVQRRDHPAHQSPRHRHRHRQQERARQRSDASSSCSSSESRESCNGESRLRPVVVYMHGGAWLLGDKDEFNSKTVSYHFAHERFVSVSVSYRLTSISNQSLTSAFIFLTVILGLFGLVSTFAEKALLMSIWLVLSAVLLIAMIRRPNETLQHPCHVLDCAHAVGWVRQNIERYGGDPSRIILVGHSAGGHLTALLSTNPKYLESVGMHPRDLVAAVCISGVYNDCALRMGTLATNLLFETFGPCAANHKDAFAIHHLRPDVCPPLFVLSAQRDFSLKRQAREFVSTARSHGVYCEYRGYPGTNHYSIILQWSKHNWVVKRDIVDFCKRALAEHAAADAATGCAAEISSCPPSSSSSGEH